MQPEGVLGVDPGGVRSLRLVDELRQQVGAAVERAPEALLLVGDPPHDAVALGLEVRIRARHQLDHPLSEAAEIRGLEPEHSALLDRAPHDPPQHVAAVLVRGNDAVGDQVDRPPHVVGDDPHRPGHPGVGSVRGPGELLGERDQGRERVGVEDRVDALLDHPHPLEPEASVDVALREVGQRAVLAQLVGHHHVVPVLEEAIGVVARPQVVGTELRPAVDVHLRARPAGAGRARLPEVVGGRQADDPLIGDADLTPDLDRLLVGTETEPFVAGEHGHPDPVRVEPEAAG